MTEVIEEGEFKSERVQQALRIAQEAHAGQFRRDGKTPYIEHPKAVGRILEMSGCDEDTIIAGLLHDTIEDTDLTLEQVKDVFGERVALLVDSVSEPPQSTHSWKERKEHTLRTLKVAPKSAVMVVAADKAHNLRSLRTALDSVGESMWMRFHGSKDLQKWYYEEMAKVIEMRLGQSPIIDEIKEHIKHLF
ncbi:bifunctional (p)ppGpp synthetase/guanosine-3',5'-bis(diphosphate) 3'-pyrophosphohydrolase [Candidatus Woesearchaeota archaeon]|nr:MAG: bifunctional (p)ppGpp synthetase/guanosine-3',5'-bis(diphosphate) 3'-pyrophosphohydrolase [Candidatus Woesearchaeota archaeon]